MSQNTTPQSETIPQEAATSSEHATPLALSADLSEAAQQAAGIIWDACLQKLCREASNSPDDEEMELSLSDRHGCDRELAREACSTSWGELADQRVDDASNWSYIHEQRRECLFRLWDNATGSRGEAEQAWTNILEFMSERDDDFDENEFESQTKDAAWEMAGEDGYDNLYDVIPRITGGIAGNAGIETPCLEFYFEEVRASAPNFKDCPDSWAEALAVLRIHPGEFANACGDLAREALAAANEIMPEDGELSSSKQEFQKSLKDALRKQGMIRRCGKDPFGWKGGLADVAAAMCKSGASLPPPGTSPDNVKKLAERIFSHGEESSSMELFFGADGDALQAQSELISRFNLDSPICCETLFARSLSINQPDIYLDGENIPFNGAVAVPVDKVEWVDESSRDRNVEPIYSKARQEACAADSLRWHIAPPHSGQAEPLSARAATLVQSLSCAPSEAFEWAIASTNPRGQDPGLLAECKDLYEMAKASALAARAKRGVPPPKNEAPLALENFDPLGGSAHRAPWRSAVPSKLAFAKDSVGNTLAHKACAGRDPGLLAHALAANPASASQRNLAGIAPIDLLLSPPSTLSNDEYFALARAFILARPDLASYATSKGQTIIGTATLVCNSKVATSHAPAIALLDMGCSLDAPRGKLAPWVTWANFEATAFIPVVKAAMARGWDINATDCQGRSLGDTVWRFDAALALAELGATFPRGIAVQNPEQRAQVESVILRMASPVEPAAPRRPKTL